MAICSLSVLIICSLSIVVCFSNRKIRTIAERRRLRLRRRKRLETPDSQTPDEGCSYTMQPTAADFPPQSTPLTHTSYCLTVLLSYCLTIIPDRDIYHPRKTPDQLPLHPPRQEL